MDYLFISENDWIPFGGSEVMWSETAALLASKGKDVSIFAKYWESEPNHYRKMKQSGCKVYYRYQKNRQLRLRHKLLNAILLKTVNLDKFKLKETNTWREFLEKNRPKLIILSLGKHIGGVDWSSLAIELDIPYVLIVQLVNSNKAPNDLLMEQLVTHYSNALKVYFCSMQNKGQLESQLATSLPQSEIIYNPFPQEITSYPTYAPVSDGYHLASVASLTIAHKGHDVLFEVLSQNKWRERPLIINLYGTGPNEITLKRLRDFYKLTNVHFAGYVADKAEIWSKNHGLILCSRMEGLSLAVLEALAYRRMVITPDIGGAKEVIIDGETGFIAEHSSFAAIDNAMEIAWNCRDEWESKGIQAEVTLRTKIPFDPIEALSEKLLKLLNHK